MRNEAGGSTPQRQPLDLNLLIALDALLAEESVTGAADRLGLSGPAMSRTLGRIRRALGDPVLVRAGRHMVPTPRALAIRAEVGRLVEDARSLFAAGSPANPATLTRAFTLSAYDGHVVAFGPGLLERTARTAPGVALRFLAEGSDAVPSLRDGTVDLEIGVIDRNEPEIRIESLLEDRMVGLVRPGHPLSQGRVTVQRFAAAQHLAVSRRGRLSGPVDAALAARGLRRRVVGTAPTFAASLFMLLRGDVVGFAAERIDAAAIAALGLVTFEVPLELPPLPIAMAWHPRQDADGGHQWLRGLVRDVVHDTLGGSTQ